MQKYIPSLAVASCLAVSNLIAIDYNEALNIVKNKSFKIFHAPYGFDNKIVSFNEIGIVTNDSNTITLQSDGTLQDSSGFNWTIVDSDDNGIILSRTDNGESPASGIMINDNINENLIDMQTMLPFYRGNTIFNTDGTIANYWNSETNFTIENGAITIAGLTGNTYYLNYQLQIAYEIGNYYIAKWSTISEENPYDQWAALDPNGYKSWYNYLSATNGKINQHDDEGLYDITSMMYTNAYPSPVPMVIDQNSTRLFVEELTPMGDLRKSTYLLENNHIVQKMTSISYFTIKKHDLNTTQENNITVPQETPDLNIYYPKGWSLSGVGKMRI